MSDIIKDAYKSLGAQEERAHIILWLCKAAAKCFEDNDDAAKQIGIVFVAVARCMIEGSDRGGDPTDSQQDKSAS